MTSLEQTARITNFPEQPYFNNLVLTTLSGLVGLRCKEFVLPEPADFAIWRPENMENAILLLAFDLHQPRPRHPLEQSSRDGLVHRKLNRPFRDAIAL